MAAADITTARPLRRIPVRLASALTGGAQGVGHHSTGRGTEGRACAPTHPAPASACSLLAGAGVESRRPTLPPQHQHPQQHGIQSDQIPRIADDLLGEEFQGRERMEDQ